MARPETHAHVRIAPVTPGKVAMWLFLATEVMFFTGLIGSYIVLAPAARTTPTAISILRRLRSKGWRTPMASCSSRPVVTRPEVEHILHTSGGLTEEQAEEVIHVAPHGLVSGLTKEKAESLDRQAPVRRS